MGDAFLKKLLVGALLALLSFGAAAQAAAPSGTFSATPLSGNAPLAVTVTWDIANTVGATPCTASGAWTGAKAAAGSQTVTFNSNGTFNLTCVGAVESAVLTWTPPTTNTDGTPLTNLASYKVYNSRDGVTFGVSVVVTAPASGYTWPNLLAGLNYWRVTAINSVGAESAPTPSVSKSLAQLSWTGSIPITVNKVPNPPTGLTVTVSTAYNIKNGKPEMVVGTVPIGTPCGEYLGRKWGFDFYKVPGSAVSPPTLGPVAAQCGQAAALSIG
jgi:hypothetical protein